jgi:hypothetical protein
MYLDFPFQIFQTPQAVAMAFEWSLDFRLIHTNGSPHPADLESWMGDSRGRWEGDTLVVDVSNYNDKTWFDMAGDFHSEALHVVERYRMTDRDTIQYQATMEDAKVFETVDHQHRAAPADRSDRLFEYVSGWKPKSQWRSARGANVVSGERCTTCGAGINNSNVGPSATPQKRSRAFVESMGNRTCSDVMCLFPEARTTAWKKDPPTMSLRADGASSSIRQMGNYRCRRGPGRK